MDRIAPLTLPSQGKKALERCESVINSWFAWVSFPLPRQSRHLLDLPKTIEGKKMFCDKIM